jgi:hypothetical protein
MNTYMSPKNFLIALIVITVIVVVGIILYSKLSSDALQRRMRAQAQAAMLANLQAQANSQTRAQGVVIYEQPMRRMGIIDGIGYGYGNSPRP